MAIKAKKTEYKGVVFRSRSEAKFARLLEKLWGYTWSYQPLDGDPNPDFLVQNNRGRMVYIEYKPRIPTKTYARQLFEDWGNNENELCIIAGSFYENTDNWHIFFMDGVDTRLAVPEWAIADANDYRFDLPHIEDEEDAPADRLYPKKYLVRKFAEEFAERECFEDYLGVDGATWLTEHVVNMLEDLGTGIGQRTKHTRYISYENLDEWEDLVRFLQKAAFTAWQHIHRTNQFPSWDSVAAEIDHLESEREQILATLASWPRR
jgi:hypothetical protein